MVVPGKYRYRDTVRELGRGTKVALVLLVSLAVVVAAVLTIPSNVLTPQQVVLEQLQLSLKDSASNDIGGGFPPAKLEAGSFTFKATVGNPNAVAVHSVQVKVRLTNPGTACLTGTVVNIEQVLPATPAVSPVDLCSAAGVVFFSSSVILTGSQTFSWEFKLTYNKAGTYIYEIVAEGSYP